MAEDRKNAPLKEDEGEKQMMLAPVGNLESYVRVINQVPMLEEEDERNLARRLRDYGDIEAARKLVLSHLRLVVSVARGYAGYGLPIADLIQEGNIGLMKAVKHFDPDVGGRLAPFAVHWIKAEIHDYVIKNWRMVKVATTKAQRKLFFKLRQNKKHLGWFTQDEREKVASDLDVSEKDVAEMETRLAGQDIGYEGEDDSSSDKQSFAPAAYLEDENSNFAKTFENNDYKTFELNRLGKALDELDSRTRTIIQKRWLEENKATLQELADELHISVERVRQIESAGLKKIKAALLSGSGKQQGALVDATAEEAAPRRKAAGKASGSKKAAKRKPKASLKAASSAKAKSDKPKSGAERNEANLPALMDATSETPKG